MTFERPTDGSQEPPAGGDEGEPSPSPEEAVPVESAPSPAFPEPDGEMGPFSDPDGESIGKSLDPPRETRER
jgi:hypothetical protein